MHLTPNRGAGKVWNGTLKKNQTYVGRGSHELQEKSKDIESVHVSEDFKTINLNI